MIHYLNYLAFWVYPYVCLAVFVAASILRFNKSQYTWRSGSSQLLRRRELVWGSNLFHYGVLAILAGHFVGLLTPPIVFHVLGISATAHQLMAVTVGGIASIFTFIGMTMLVHRRLFDARIRRTSSRMDIFVLLLIYFQLIFGMATLPISLQHLDGSEMEKLIGWVQRIVTFRTGAVESLAGVYWIFRVHLILGMTLFLVLPFSRLVHIVSAPIWYFGRPYEIVRSKRVSRGMENLR